MSEPIPETGKPMRVQLSRLKGWRMPPNTVKVDRSTKFGNPFRVTPDQTAVAVVCAFRTWITVDGVHAGRPLQKHRMIAHLETLRGKNLACWCKPGAPCHADVLLEIANR